MPYQLAWDGSTDSSMAVEWADANGGEAAPPPGKGDGRVSTTGGHKRKSSSRREVTVVREYPLRGAAGKRDCHGGGRTQVVVLHVETLMPSFTLTNFS